MSDKIIKELVDSIVQQRIRALGRESDAKRRFQGAQRELDTARREVRECDDALVKLRGLMPEELAI